MDLFFVKRFFCIFIIGYEVFIYHISDVYDVYANASLRCICFFVPVPVRDVQTAKSLHLQVDLWNVSIDVPGLSGLVFGGRIIAPVNL